jgi:hypothetical protein
MPRGHHRRRFHRGGQAHAKITNRTEMEKLVENSISVSISIGGNLNVTATNRGSSNAVANSDETRIHNED